MLSTRCRVGTTDLGPLVTEWPGPEKANLEALLHRDGAAAVQFTGCSMRLLPQCALGGSYVWQRTSPSRDVIAIDSEADLFTRLPLGALSLRGELKRSGELSVDTTVSGQVRLQGFSADLVPQTQGCLEATHVVLAMSVGAYEMRSADRFSTGGSIGYAGVEAGGSSRRSSRVLGTSGNAASCALATAEAAHPNCASPIQVFLGPIPGRTEPPGPPGSVKVGFQSGTHDVRWDVTIDDEARCSTPCDQWVDPSRPVVLRSRSNETLTVRSLDGDRGPLQVTAYPTSRGKLATGITFTAVGGLAVLTGISLTGVGCSLGDQPGMCTAGLITTAAGIPVTVGAIYLILGALPRSEVLPIFDTRKEGVVVGPGSVSGRF